MCRSAEIAIPSYFNRFNGFRRGGALIKYLGFAAVLLSAAIFSIEYAKKQRRRVFEAEEFLRFLAHIRRELFCFAAPIGSWLDGFHSPLFGELKFSEQLSETESLPEAFSRLEWGLALDARGLEILHGYFSSAGHSYLEEELRLADKAIEEFGEYATVLRDTAPKNIKLMSVICTSVSLGLVILLL